MKTNKSTASKSTKLTDAPETQVSTSNPPIIMQPDNSTNPNPAVNAVANENLFDNEQIPAEATAISSTTEPPKQQRIGKQQRKSDFAEFKATFLVPSKLVKRHPVNIEDSVWEKLERIARILGDRGTSVSSYANAILAEHLKQYADDIEIWRKL